MAYTTVTTDCAEMLEQFKHDVAKHRNHKFCLFVCLFLDDGLSYNTAVTPDYHRNFAIYF
jgi:hypothetical protein